MQIRATGQAPYGFRWNEHRLASNGEEAVIRKTIFELFAEHQSKGTVARILNERGLQTRRGSKWSDMAVSRQLACSSAKGLYAINKTTTDKSGLRIERPEKDWEFIECDQIVSDDLWDHVQLILEEQKESRSLSGKKPVHTFSGILCCFCGGNMAVPSNSPKYVCTKCRNKIPCEDLEEIFRDQLSRLILDRPDIFGDPPSSDENIADAEDLLSEAREKLRKAKSEMTHFERLIAADKISLERFGEVHSPLEEKRETLSKKIRRLESIIRKEKSTSLSNEEVDAEDFFDFRSLVDQWHELPLDDRRAIVQSLVDQITIGDGQVEFAYLFPNKSEGFLKDVAVSQQMGSSTNDNTDAPTNPDEPHYIRLPKAGKRCHLTGMSRSKLNELILPSERNSFKPPVKSLSLKLPGRTRGTRLIVWPSLKQLLSDQE